MKNFMMVIFGVFFVGSLFAQTVTISRDPYCPNGQYVDPGQQDVVLFIFNLEVTDTIRTDTLLFCFHGHDVNQFDNFRVQTRTGQNWDDWETNSILDIPALHLIVDDSLVVGDFVQLRGIADVKRDASPGARIKFSLDSTGLINPWTVNTCDTLFLYQISGVAQGAWTAVRGDTIPTSISEKSTMDEVFLWPNPTTSVIHVRVASDTEYGIMNPLGQCIERGTTSGQIRCGNLKNGEYFLKLFTKNGPKVHKFLKKE